VRRRGGFSPIRDYAVIGDGRTAALVASDGSIDWLCLPNFDSPSVFAALLDADRGGAFVVQPVVPFTSSRRYLPGTNLLETTFTTAQGRVRLLDAVTLPDAALSPLREIARLVEGVDGSVPMEWSASPRFCYGKTPGKRAWRGRVPVATSGADGVAFLSWDAGSPSWSSDGYVGASWTVDAGQRSMVSLAAAYGEPLVFPSRRAVEARLRATERFWREWSAARTYDGPFRDAVVRSALALKLMIFAPSGASVAAPTTSLPEEIGGVRNWDYRFCWIRDSAFLIDALLRLGCRPEAQALFWWFMQATARTAPVLQVLYRLDGGAHAAEQTVPLGGYRGSSPVRVGNAAVEQYQLDLYGDFLETTWLYAKGEWVLDRDTGVRVAAMADHVCRIWRRPDAGIWEVRDEPRHFTHSKVMCWVALDRAIRLADEDDVPRAHINRWKNEAAAIVAFVESECWSERLQSYVQYAGGEALDASLLMLSLMGYGGAENPRVLATVDAVARDLRRGPFVYRYRNDDGLPGSEGCFVNCSFWLIGALARVGRVAEARSLMTDLLAMANDVGLFAEEIEPDTGAFLGNFPQALVHLSLIDAALAIGEAEQASQGPKKGKASA
jgi:GH15 family glucan-1,4-alpha-glucosidase